MSSVFNTYLELHGEINSFSVQLALLPGQMLLFYYYYFCYNCGTKLTLTDNVNRRMEEIDAGQIQMRVSGANWSRLNQVD